LCRYLFNCCERSLNLKIQALLEQRGTYIQVLGACFPKLTLDDEAFTIVDHHARGEQFGGLK
jgi:hypothetical protein